MNKILTEYAITPDDISIFNGNRINGFSEGEISLEFPINKIIKSSDALRRAKKNYRLRNLEQIKLNNKQYQLDHQERIKFLSKKYYSENKRKANLCSAECHRRMNLKLKEVKNLFKELTILY